MDRAISLGENDDAEERHQLMTLKYQNERLIRRPVGNPILCWSADLAELEFLSAKLDAATEAYSRNVDEFYSEVQELRQVVAAKRVASEIADDGEDSMMEQAPTPSKRIKTHDSESNEGIIVDGASSGTDDEPMPPVAKGNDGNISDSLSKNQDESKTI